MNIFIKSSIAIVATMSLSACLGKSSDLSQYRQELIDATIVPVAEKGENINWTFIDTDGKTSGRTYELLGCLHEGRAIYCVQDSTRNLHGYVDENGQIVIEARYSTATDFSDGLAWVSKPDSSLMVIDRNGNTVFRCPEAYTAEIFGNGCAKVSDLSGNIKILDRTGSEITFPEAVENVSEVDDGFVIARSNDHSRLYRMDKKEFKPVEELDKFNISDFYGGWNLAVTESNGKFGLVNLKGEYIVNPRYKDLMRCNNLIAFMNDKKKIGFLDKHGEEVIPAKYKAMQKPVWGSRYIAVSTSGSRWQIIDEKGEPIIAAKYDKIMPLNKTIFAVMKDDKWGLADASKGEITCEPQFDKIVAMGNVLFASTGLYMAVINSEGKILSDEKYVADTYPIVRKATSQYVSPEQIAALIMKAVDIMPADVNAETVASEFDLTKFDFQPGYPEAELTNMPLPGSDMTVSCIFNSSPVYESGYYTKKRNWNTNCRPVNYFISMVFDNAEKCKAVVALLCDKYNMPYGDGITADSFTDCSTLIITIEPNEKHTCSISPYIMDYGYYEEDYY